MKNSLLVILALISTTFCFSQNQVVSGFEPTTGRPGYKYTLKNLYVTSPLYNVNDSTIGMDTSKLSFTVSKNAAHDSIIFLFKDGTRIAIRDSIGGGSALTASTGLKIYSGDIHLGDSSIPHPFSGIYEVIWNNTNGAFRVGQSGSATMGLTSFAIGAYCNAGDRAFAGGYSSVSSGTMAYSYGNGLLASGQNAVAFGEGDNGSSYGTASGAYSFLTGLYNNVTGRFAATYGGYSNTSAVGGLTSGYWNNNTSAGHYNAQVSTDTGAVTIGMYNTTSGKGSFAAGIDNRAYGYGNVTLGVYADSAAAASTTAWSARNKAFVVGNGTAQTARSNAFVVYQGGGMVIPKMTKTQRDALSGMVQGEMVFVTDNGGYLSWYNSGWFKVNSTAD